MIIARTTFRLKFGKAKEAINIWKQMGEHFKGLKDVPQMRILTDVTGPSYTLTLEMSLRSLNEIGLMNYNWMTSDIAKELYQQFIPLCESANREYLNVEMEIGGSR